MNDIRKLGAVETAATIRVGMKDLWKLGALETVAAIRARKISALDAIGAAVDRMQAVNARVNAVTMDLSKTALEAAYRADRALKDGHLGGALHGVPITIKENVDQKGLANTNGVKAFAEKIAPEDSPVVANLLKAGAIVIGRTNTPEFSLRWFTDNELRGRTDNPWNKDVTPGGSSGGAAASVALGIGAITHGNDPIELAPRGICVNAVAASAVETEALKFYFKEGLAKDSRQATPAGRMVAPECCQRGGVSYAVNRPL